MLKMTEKNIILHWRGGYLGFTRIKFYRHMFRKKLNNPVYSGTNFIPLKIHRVETFRKILLSLPTKRLSKKFNRNLFTVELKFGAHPNRLISFLPKSQV